jgi:hypothetical protein
MSAGLYDYTIPPGYGDTFFLYGYNGDALVPGGNYDGQTIKIADGQFIARAWAGQETVAAGGIQIYDKNRRSLTAAQFINFINFTSGQILQPEVDYDDTADIRFDLLNAQPTVASTDAGANKIFASQLVFSGVRRRKNRTSDPGPSPYTYYEQPFAYPYTISLTNYATNGAGVLLPPIQNQISIQNHDFELRRIEMSYASTQGAVNATNAFKFTLYDNSWIQTSNGPILASRFFHFNNAASAGQQNFQPCPPLLYKIGSMIRFDIWSLLSAPTALPQTFQVTFQGIRRIPCR